MLLAEAHSLLALEWSDHFRPNRSDPEPDALEWDLARTGQFPPTKEDMIVYMSRPRKPPGLSANGFVYFIQSFGQGLIKIGSSDDPRNRLSVLQCGSPVALHLVGVIDGGEARERELHRRFAEERRHGEWFEASKRLVEFIRESNCAE